MFIKRKNYTYFKHIKKSQVAHDFLGMFGYNCGDGKWVDIRVNEIDAFIKGVNMHIGAIAKRRGGGGWSLKLKAMFQLCYLFLALKLQVFIHFYI